MKKLNLLKSLIMVMAVLLSTDKAFCEATAVQALYTLVQPTVAVEKTASVEVGNINPSNGNASELKSSFNLQSNDEQTFFVVYSKITILGGTQVSAFDTDGNLFFANTQIPPTETAVNNAKQGLIGNANVIGYKINLSGESITITSTTSATYKECFKITLADSETSGRLEQTVGGTPAPNTYLAGEDVSGSYAATVYVTAVTEI